jgi:phospholipid transport system substrate-binding protein
MFTLRVIINICLMTAGLVMFGATHAADPVEQPSVEDIEEASAFVQELADATITSLNDVELSESDRRTQFNKLIDQGFASDYIAKVVLGRYWHKLTPEQRPEYMRLFKSFMLETLMSRLSAFNDEYLEILGHEFTKKGDIFVMSQVVMVNDAFDVDWRVRRFQGVYKIIDVRLEGISMVITNHEEFTGTAFSEGIDGLLNSLRKWSPPVVEPLANSIGPD